MDHDDLIAALGPEGEHRRRELVARATVSDRAVPAAREWLRRWAPKPMPVPVPACACAQGRCAVCN